jgi:CDP-glycerol glycerophosphotransferase (TagB/SpsB family)
MQTDFYQSYQQLLNDPALEDCLAAHNATLQVFLHPLFLHLSHLLSSKNDHVQILHPDDAPLNQIIMGCSAMVTDYSSAVWDAIYQGKPAIFFQFDRALYLEKTGSYIDFETDLPGECYLDIDGLIEGLQTTIEGGFVPSERQEEVSRRWFAHRDANNCKRIYECACEIEKTITQ